MTSGRGRFIRKAGLDAGRSLPARLILAGLALALASAAQAAEPRHPMKLPDTKYEPALFSDIDGWMDDDHDAGFAAFSNSCRAILKSAASTRESRPMLAALYGVCRKAADIKPSKPGEARAFFEQNFSPFHIAPAGAPEGFLTGYYEPIVEGKREATDGFDFPLYRAPGNLLPGGRMVIAGAASGKKKARKRKVASYYERAAIDDGVLAGRNLEICWLKDPIEAFFIHIQGSVRVRLDDGKMMRLNYQAANGHPYYAVGRWLIERKIVSKEDMSMDRIREWMERNPDEGKELRRRNKSYVFFRETGLATNEEPVGAQGISLVPGRSIAVDRNLHTYGTPFFISSELPIESEKAETPFRRLMVAQDTGGAIIGPARADIYFGAGDEAASIAGRIKQNGRFVMLVPHELDPRVLKGVIPLPKPRPDITAPEAKAEPEASAKGAAKPGKAAKKREAAQDHDGDKPAKKRKAKHKG